MRAIAACHFTLNRSGAWRRAVSVLTGLVVLALLSWFAERHETLHWGLAVVLGALILAVLGLGASLLRSRPVDLRWDGRDWHAGPVVSAGQEPQPGALSVSIDLGNWMLLRFQADDASMRRGVTWLPVQRNGLESQWHALRCAVYSPRPARDVARSLNAAADL